MTSEKEEHSFFYALRDREGAIADVRYHQFCALARAAEIVGERWTLLIVRELLLGPKRFADLRERLDGVSSSVLAARLARAERLGLVRRSTLPPPAPSTVYELTEDGRALEPAVLELVRWGGRFLLPPRPGERVEPEWIRLALAACARRGASPPRSVLVRIRDGGKEGVAHVAGGPGGTVVTGQPAPAEATLTGPFHAILAVVARAVDPLEAADRGWIAATGDREALRAFPDLFELPAGTVRGGDPLALLAGGSPGRAGDARAGHRAAGRPGPARKTPERPRRRKGARRGPER